MGIFSLKNVIQKSCSAKLFSVPQTRRQVSAYEFSSHRIEPLECNRDVSYYYINSNDYKLLY